MYTRKYRYRGMIFDSCWELAYYIYCIDNNIELTSNGVYNKLVKGEAVEGDIKEYLQYIYHRYGKEYLKLFRDKRKGDYKRKIIEVERDKKGELDIESLIKYKNKNVRFHYVCDRCGRDVYTTWHLLSHFRDGLCKYCRTH